MQEQKKQLGRIQVIDGAEEHFLPTRALCDERYGEGYCTRRVYDAWMQGLLKIALYNGEYAGFAVMLPADIARIMKAMQMTEDEVRAIEDERPLLIYKSAAVRECFEHRGIMTAMAQTGLREAQEKGYGALFASAWVHDGGIPIEGTFAKYGFHKLFERHMLWYDDPDYHCIVCGGRCVCDGIIYYKKL